MRILIALRDVIGTLLICANNISWLYQVHVFLSHGWFLLLFLCFFLFFSFFMYCRVLWLFLKIFVRFNEKF